jgi:hypothetical protein
MIIFIALATEYFSRFTKDLPVRGQDAHYRDSLATMVNSQPWNQKLKFMSIGVVIVTGFLLIRYAGLPSYIWCVLDTPSPGLSIVPLNSLMDGLAIFWEPRSTSVGPDKGDANRLGTELRSYRCVRWRNGYTRHVCTELLQPRHTSFQLRNQAG